MENQEIQEINIDLDAIKEVSYLGIKRSAAFLGLGLNAANNPDFNNYTLTDFAFIEYFPRDLDVKTVSGFKNEFGIWIIANGLRELTETHVIFLDRIFDVCLLVAKTLPTKVEKTKKDFYHQGIEGKLAVLSKLFNLSTSMEKYLVELNNARNCYTHRRGIVASKDLNFEDKLRLRWMGFDIYTVNEDGQREDILPPIPSDGVSFSSPRNVIVNSIERDLIFSAGEEIKLTPHNLSEICKVFVVATNEIISSITAFIESQGIPVIGK